MWEFSIIELESGRVLINTLVNHGAELSHRTGFPGMEAISQAHARRIYNRNRANIEHLDVHEIAECLKSIGIDSSTIVLVWAVNRQDLRILINFVASGGYDVEALLPPIENCLPLINRYKHNLGKLDGRPFPMKLDWLFGTVFPQSTLRFHSHEALADCRQTRLLWHEFQRLMKPIDRQNRRQLVLKDFLMKSPSIGKNFQLSACPHRI